MPGEWGCRICKPGYYLKTDLTCSNCSDEIPGCKLCQKIGLSSVECTECQSPTRRNFNCQLEFICDNSNCAKTWKTDNSGTCKCSRCSLGKVLRQDHKIQFGNCTSERVPGLLPNCLYESKGFFIDYCLECESG